MDPSAAVTEEGPPDVEVEVSDGLATAELCVVVTLVDVEDWEVVLDDADVANVVVSAGDETTFPVPPEKDVTTLGQFVWIVASAGPGWIGLHPGRVGMNLPVPVSSGTMSLTLPLQADISASVYKEPAPKQDDESRGSGVFPTLQVFMAAASTPSCQPLI